MARPTELPIIIKGSNGYPAKPISILVTPPINKKSEGVCPFWAIGKYT